MTKKVIDVFMLNGRKGALIFKDADAKKARRVYQLAEERNWIFDDSFFADIEMENLWDMFNYIIESLDGAHAERIEKVEKKDATN